MAVLGGAIYWQQKFESLAAEREAESQKLERTIRDARPDQIDKDAVVRLMRVTSGQATDFAKLLSVFAFISAVTSIFVIMLLFAIRKQRVEKVEV